MDVLIERLLDKGLIGVVVLLLLVIVYQYRENRALSAKLFDYAESVRKSGLEALGASTAAVGKLTMTLEGAIDKSDERAETQKALHLQSVKMAEMVASNGESIKTTAAATQTALGQLFQLFAGGRS